MNLFIMYISLLFCYFLSLKSKILKSLFLGLRFI
jgi:hypothetical protein